MYMKLKEVVFYFVCAFNICLDPFLTLHDDEGLRGKLNLLLGVQDVSYSKEAA